MTNAQIKCFLAVTRCRSFSKAAERLYISQPAASKQVAAMEKELGFSLIDRTYGEFQLTPAGKLFFDFFEHSLESYDRLLEDARQLTDGHTGDIRLGCLDGWDLSQFYPEIRDLFREKYPNIRLHLDGFNHGRILDALYQGEIDLAITLGATLPRRERLARREIASAPAVILVSVLHPLIQGRQITLKDFQDEPFYVVTPTPQASNAMEELTVELCRQAGFEPWIERASNSAVILMRLQSGSGVQITCEWTGACRLPMYRAIPLDHQLSISAAWLEDEHNPAKRIFINELLSRKETFSRSL